MKAPVFNRLSNLTEKKQNVAHDANILRKLREIFDSGKNAVIRRRSMNV